MSVTFFRNVLDMGFMPAAKGSARTPLGPKYNYMTGNGIFCNIENTMTTELNMKYSTPYGLVLWIKISSRLNFNYGVINGQRK